MSTDKQLMLITEPVPVQVYASISREHLYEQGKSIGLEGEALDFFCYTNEVALRLYVNYATGEVKKVEVAQ